MSEPVPGQGDRQSRRRGGRHWVVAAVGMPALLAWGLLVVRLNGRYVECVTEHGPTSTDMIDGVAGPCYSITMRAVVVYLGFLAALVATVVVGVVLGVVDGRRRCRFAYARWVCVVVVGLTGTLALAAYALAYGLGRLLPAHRPPRHRPQPSDVALQQGWIEAIRLHQRLARGEPPPTVVALGFIGPGVVYLDAPFTYSRFYGTTVTYGQSSTFAVGSPMFVTGSVVGDMIGNSVARSRAASLAQPQWREFTYARVVVTPTTTWCSLGGRWLAFDHDAAMEYTIDGPNCVLTFAEVEPLRLSGPSAWHHAVMFAYARYGPAQWQDAPFLHPLREAARSLATPNPRFPQQNREHV
ncbi:hypothetical protein QTQ03_08325 [Micromonospora sp. WMMA1363]|uniref:hypothetical protein n=1 Tax=Micromonospora sp. WMMA1363 TaxID=3053985 RepID=UPI00259D00B2|nr:hypothetical protein [Micromonospora sp. WMMA1363]MDM4719595.1 hypothetical protein [Micromonospora sp. WMMA1363]